MRKLALILLFLASFLIRANNDVLFYRKLIIASEKNAEVAKLFEEKTAAYDEKSDAIYLGFKAMAFMLQSKHHTNPFTRLSYFNKGKDCLETAIAKEPANPELIYFRFSVQTNVPPLLKYSSKIKTDKVLLINYLKENFSNKNKDVDLYNNIKSFLLQSHACTPTEKEALKKL